MDHRKLRDCFGLFATGIIIACARKKNFFADTFFAEKFFDKKIFTQTILANNFLAQKFKKIFREEFFGMTINSFTSISLNPPLVLFSIDNNSSNLSLFKKNRYFSLNILSEEQIELARAFATPKNSTKWGVEPYFFGQKGSPIFYKSLGFFECRKHRVIEMGDHHLIIGEIINFDKINEKSPLLYNRGKYEFLELKN